MPVSQSVAPDGKKVEINVSGRFDYVVYQDFRDAYRNLPGPGVAYHVDLSDAEYMDSSALGMLLLLREHAGGDAGTVVLDHPSEQISKVLKLVNFEKLFTIN